MKGVAASIGTPPQDIVLLPWPDINNTWIYDQQAYCDSTIIWNDVICRVRRGNYYGEGNSSSWAKAEDIMAAGGASVETQSPGEETGVSKLTTTSLGGTDHFTFDPDHLLSNLPVGIPRLNWDHGYTILHAMGMGRNSTILNALLETGQIGSRVWSIFWGRMWVEEDAAIDGSVVFGGYDQQKVIGKNYTQPLDFSDETGCWTGMKVHISGIKLSARNGREADLLDYNTDIPVCIVPQRQLLLEGPQAIVDNFEYQTGMQNKGSSYGLHWGAFLYNTSNLFDGDMTISFTTGLNVRIPNSQYLVPYVAIDRNGSRIFDRSERELLISAVGEQPATLGRYFLTAAYLMVDLDASTFTLWQANPTSESKLVSRAAPSECENTTSTGSGSGSSAAPQNDPQSPQTRSGLSRGSIAGIVVGALAGIAISGIGIFLYLRRARKRSQHNQETAIPPGYVEETQAGQLYGFQPPDNTKAELRGSLPVLPEMTGQDHYTYELDGNATIR
ncbi:hypothetical protein M426DRAFT_54273 [Hypoxylon sp. CI-4A]|nr:hypothetical protein M426DRAFT_54273 [Hypoxylon sp. CI-4A]